MINTLRFMSVILLILGLPACNDTEKVESCVNAIPVATPQALFFDNSMIKSRAEEGASAISCHNCYDVNNMDNTFALIAAAIDDGAQVIEIDLVQKDAAEAEPVVGHGSNAEGISYIGLNFEQVFENDLLVYAEQVLFIEIKNKINSKVHIRNILDVLKTQENQFGEPAYFNANRFTVFRNLANYDTLSLFRDVLAEAEYLSIQPYVKLSRIFNHEHHGNFVNDMTQAYQCGFHMVEFSHEIGIEKAVYLNAFAETLGLGVNIFTLTEDNYSAITLDMAYEVDVLTVEPNRALQSIQAQESIFIRVNRIIQGG